MVARGYWTTVLVVVRGAVKRNEGREIRTRARTQGSNANAVVIRAKGCQVWSGG